MNDRTLRDSTAADTRGATLLQPLARSNAFVCPALQSLHGLANARAAILISRLHEIDRVFAQHPIPAGAKLDWYLRRLEWREGKGRKKVVSEIEPSSDGRRRSRYICPVPVHGPVTEFVARWRTFSDRRELLALDGSNLESWVKSKRDELANETRSVRDKRRLAIEARLKQHHGWTSDEYGPRLPYLCSVSADRCFT